MEFSVTHRNESGVEIVSVGGEVDVYTAPKLREELLEAIASGANHLVVDMGEVTFLDSTGLGVLVGALKRARQQEKTLSLVVWRNQVLRVFSVTGLTEVFDIKPSVSEALPASA